MNTYPEQKALVPEEYQEIALRIDEHLQQVLAEDIYEKWTQHFVLEEVGDDEICFGYYGSESLRRLKKEYVSTVWLHICSVVGYDKNLQIYPRHFSEPISEEQSEAEQTEETVLPKEDFMFSEGSSEFQKNLYAAKLFGISFLFVMITLIVAVIGFNYIGNRSFHETFYNVGSLKVDDNVRILQISDLHNSIYGKGNGKLVDRVKKLKPDMILLTGDCVESSERSLERTLQLCTELSKIAPSYYIYGNNEVERSYSFPLTQEKLDEAFGFTDENRTPKTLLEQPDALEKALEETGVKVLKNATDTLTVGTTVIDVYGVLTSNPSAFWSYAGESFDEYLYQNPTHFKLFAMHEPILLEEFSPESWGDIMLCGHTHGGTIRLPMIGPFYTHEGGILPGRSGAYVYGRYEVEGSPLIVSSGLENHNLFRMNNPPELVIIDINRF